MKVTLKSDRLYGIEMRPQELALYGEKVDFHLRFGPTTEPDEVVEQHFKLLVVEVTAELDADNEVGRPAGRLQLLKCGWELEVMANEPVAAEDLPQLPEELPLLMGRIADTVNELARRAGLEAPLGPAVIDQLLANC